MRYEALIIFVVSIFGCGAWNNDWDQPLHFTCRKRYQTIQRIESEHSDYREDRRFALECVDLPIKDAPIEHCAWTGYVNYYDEYFNFGCPSNGFISGVYSSHSNYHEDRRWKFYCCNLNGYYLYDCHDSGFVNDFDAKFRYTLQDNTVLTGMNAIHRDKYEDRRFGFRYCRLRKCAI